MAGVESRRQFLGRVVKLAVAAGAVGGAIYVETESQRHGFDAEKFIRGNTLEAAPTIESKDKWKVSHPLKPQFQEFEIDRTRHVLWIPNGDEIRFPVTDDINSPLIDTGIHVLGLRYNGQILPVVSSHYKHNDYEFEDQKVVRTGTNPNVRYDILQFTSGNDTIYTSINLRDPEEKTPVFTLKRYNLKPIPANS